VGYDGRPQSKLRLHGCPFFVDDPVDIVVRPTSLRRSRDTQCSGCIVVPLDTETAVAATEIGATRKRATADAIIYATAQAHDATLLTCDRHFENLPDVCYLTKPAA
jgi:predicted nucleic acid-binding protein